MKWYGFHGWDTQRLRFLLKLCDCHHQIGASVTQYIRYYTSFPGVTTNGAIAPDMVFYINSIIETRKIPVQTPTGYSESMRTFP
jgi:hypothetical protein